MKAAPPAQGQAEGAANWRTSKIMIGEELLKVKEPVPPDTYPAYLAVLKERGYL